MRRWIIIILWLLVSHTGLTQDTTGTVIKIESDQQLEETTDKIQTICIKTIKGDQIKGLFQSLVEDTLFVLIRKHGLLDTNIHPKKIPIHEIKQLSLGREVSSLKGLWIFVSAFTGGAIGYNRGDDPGSFLSVSADAKSALGTIVGLLVGYFYSDFYEALASLDIDVSWQDKTDAEKKIILGQIITGKYRPGYHACVLPWARRLSALNKNSVFLNGVTIRILFHPRAGFELEYGKSYKHNYSTSWSQDPNEQFSFYSAGFFYFLTKSWVIKPFMSYGFSILNQRMPENRNNQDNNSYSIYLGAGVQKQFFKRLILEGRFDGSLGTNGFISPIRQQLTLYLGITL